MTKGIPDDDQLFTGLKRTVWTDTLKNSPYEEHIGTTKEEVEAALATKPNGSILGLEVCQMDDQEFRNATRPDE